MDIVDYIVRCTHKIWEEKSIGALYTHYAHNIIYHSADGTTSGRDPIIAACLQIMAAFPNVRIYAEDVIWDGDDEQGFHTFHRGRWVATNTGYSAFGPPTGRTASRRAIAHCIVKDNFIVEEWVVRDEMTFIRQLGLDPHALAQEMVAREVTLGLSHAEQRGRGEVERLQGQLPPTAEAGGPGNASGVEGFVRQSIHEIWNLRLINKVDAYYADTLTSYLPSSREMHGRGDYKQYVLALLGAFPDASVAVDYVCCLGNEQEGHRVAVQWRLQGTHLGPSMYGPPSGKRVHILGITQLAIQQGKIQSEWAVWDEFALLKQIARPPAGA